ncbi:MAG: phage major capsid protein [Anaerovoracaceae bacterium]
MATSRGNLFDPKLVTDLMSKVKGKSSLAKLCAAKPVPFNGSKEFMFSMDSEVDIVAENGKKGHGGITLSPIAIVPIKVEYGARVSDEFLISTEEEQINILESFNDGFAKKVARGIDLMAIHGVNPRTGTASTVIGDNNFDSKITQTVVFDKADPEANIETAVGLVQGSNGDVNGIAMSTIFSSELAKLKVNGVKQYPELAWGGNPESMNGLQVDINETISAGSSLDRAIIGDFQNRFKWGFAKQIPLEIIKYGDPDNTGMDLKGYNQVYLRAEVYIGWGILDENSFAIVKEKAEA